MNQEHAGFLARCGLPADCTVEPLAGGANNRVFKITADDRQRVLKQYFQRADDPRDRFAAEYDFYTALWNTGVRAIPEPLAWDRGRNLGLFEFVSGRKLKTGEIDRDRVSVAVRFLIETNRKAGGVRLNSASEACFSLTQHHATVDRRIARLKAVTEPEARDFIAGELVPAWRRVSKALLEAANDDVELAREERCISPSDFGFHNALLLPDGKLKFFDFEYAGADDPAKLICDYFCQPRLPVGLEHWEFFTSEFTRGCGWDGSIETRARRLLPVYQIKWCCIMLNEFLRSDAERRAFAGEADALEKRQREQLYQAGQALARVQS